MIVFIASIQQQEAILNAEESLHCSKVLRKKIGDAVHLIDGKGMFYEGTLIQVTEKRCVAKISGSGREQPKRNHYLHLAIAPTKQIDRTEWLIEKAVELGVDEITLFRCHNSERTHVNADRLKKIVESAVKQSMQARIPGLHALVDFKNLLNDITASQKFIAHCDNVDKKHIRDVVFKNEKSLVLIGPEGDFSPEEIKQALEQGFKSLSLGENRLRTETAGLAVVQAAFLLD